MSDFNVLFVQPSLLKYRLDFFDKIYLMLGRSLKVYYSEGNLGALSIEVERQWSYRLQPVKSFLNFFFWQVGVFKIIIKKNDIIVLSGNPRYISTLILMIKAKLIGAKIVWWGHYWSSTSRRWRQILRFIPMMFADAILFYTDDEVKKFKNDPFFLVGRYG